MQPQSRRTKVEIHLINHSPRITIGDLPTTPTKHVSVANNAETSLQLKATESQYDKADPCRIFQVEKILIK